MKHHELKTIVEVNIKEIKGRLHKEENHSCKV